MTTETIQLIFGITMDTLVFLAVFVYIPISNRRIRKKERMQRIWRKIEPQLDFEPMYWWEKEEF